MKRPVVTIYTDGSCKNGKGGWAARLTFGNDSLNLHGSVEETTNNRMELTAVLEAIKVLNTPCIIRLYSDSRYVLNGLSFMYLWRFRDWKTREGKDVQNRDLWEELLEFIGKGGHSVRKHWVKGHIGDIENEICDSLAKYARENPVNAEASKK